MRTGSGGECCEMCPFQVGTGSPVLLTNVERFGGLLSRMMTKSSSRAIYGMSNYGKAANVMLKEVCIIWS